MTNDEYPITKGICLILSTRHLSQTTKDLLDRGEDGYPDLPEQIEIFANDEYGWFITWRKSCNKMEVPDDLAACMKLAERNECNMIQLHAAHVPTPELLPIYTRE